jgi:PncC family amidohydrolase
VSGPITKLLHQEAAEVALLLKASRAKLVLAESCTGGLASATLARIPGISHRLCGSAVVYRTDTKVEWLGIPRAVFRRYPDGVSGEVASRMARQVLKRTPEATISAAVTGHLGPGAPKGQDGRIFVAGAVRGESRTVVDEGWVLPTRSTSKSGKSAASLRVRRQILAALAVLFMVRSLLEFAKTRQEA